MSTRLVGTLVVAGSLVLAGVAAALVVTDDDDSRDRSRPPVETNETMCSASLSGTELEQPDDMPDAVYETALTVARAATACDYDELARLAGPDFQFSFGGIIGGDAAVEDWQAAEERGEPVLRTLHDLLIGPYVFDGERLVWPTTETTDFRTGISTDGEWQFFVAGD